MGIGKLSYEECRQRRVEENKKRLEELNLVHISQTLRNLSPKSSPMKKVGKPRTIENQMVAIRRSPRVAKIPAPVYVEVTSTRFSSPRKNYGVPRKRDFTNIVYATEEARSCAIEKAEQLAAKLEVDGYPTLIRSMLPSHVSGGFWLGLPVDFCRQSLPNVDGMVVLVDEQGEEYPTVYLARKRGLSGGWKGFAEAHELVDGDAVIFQVVSHSMLKVYIIRTSGYEDEDGNDMAAQLRKAAA